jgi:TonB family protein
MNPSLKRLNIVKKRILTTILSLVFVLGCCAESAKAQWIPKRVVGMDYPKLARMARIEGRVEIACTINSDGSVASIKPIGNPHPLLLKTVEENAFKWKFMRTSDLGRSQSTATLTYSFTMERTGSAHPVRTFAFEYPSSVILTSEQCELESPCE